MIGEVKLEVEQDDEEKNFYNEEKAENIGENCEKSKQDDGQEKDSEKYSSVKSSPR